MSNVVKNKSQLVGSHHSTSTMLQLCSGSVLLCFLCFFTIFPLFSLFFTVFPPFPLFFSILLLGSFVFPLLSLFLCLVPLLSLYFLYLFLSTLSKTHRSYLRTVLRSSCLCSFTSQPILRRISILTTLLMSLDLLIICVVLYVILKISIIVLHLHLFRMLLDLDISLTSFVIHLLLFFPCLFRTHRYIM